MERKDEKVLVPVRRIEVAEEKEHEEESVDIKDTPTPQIPIRWRVY